MSLSGTPFEHAGVQVIVLLAIFVAVVVGVWGALRCGRNLYEQERALLLGTVTLVVLETPLMIALLTLWPAHTLGRALSVGVVGHTALFCLYLAVSVAGSYVFGKVVMPRVRHH